MEFIPYKANECFEHLYYQIPMELFFNTKYKDKLNSDSKKYVTGINCMADIAYKEMSITKEQFNKTGGTLGFHAYQSFKGCEVTNDEAHEIGIRLAEEL